MVQESEAGVVSAPVDALSLLAFGLGQDPAPGLEFDHEPVELFAGDAGQGGVGEQVSGLGRDRLAAEVIRPLHRPARQAIRYR